ncbi:MAG: hypothetical protein HY456_01210 [Parcubacteria group bacterium]|nr:hypothetical protein [Parcubacteria group bacterium]
MDERINLINQSLKNLLSRVKMQDEQPPKSLKEKGIMAWVEKFDEKTGTIQIGMALGSAAGCSPFCGCAAHQIAEAMGEVLKKEFPEIKKVVGIAKLPPEEITKKWNE